jgi:hypothetical protein
MNDYLRGELDLDLGAIVETSDNRLYWVDGTDDSSMPQVWRGIAVKRVKGGFAPKAGKLRAELIRKAGSRVVRL